MPFLCGNSFVAFLTVDFAVATNVVLSILLAAVCALLVIVEGRRKGALRAKDESRLLATHLVESARDGIIAINEAGLIQTINPAAQKMFGYTEAEVRNTSVSRLLPPPEKTQRSKNGGSTIGTTYIHAGGKDLAGVRKGGSTFPVDVVLSEVNLPTQRLFSALVRDTSERRKSERALANERNLVTAVLDNAGALIVVLDHEARIVRFNRACEDLFQYSQGEIKGRFAWELFAAPDKHEQMQAEMENLLRGKFPAREESIWLTRALVPKTIEWNYTSINDALGRLEYIIAIGADATERRRLEGQLAHASKMEAVGRLAGGVAHDFNNLLTAITGYSSLLLDSIENESQRRDVEEIHKASERAALLTRQLLAFSRKQVLLIRNIDVNLVVDDFQRILKRVIGEDITLDLNLAPEALTVKADKAQLEQVLMNLSVNARDAMPKGGRLTISSARVELAGANAEGLQAGGYVKIEFSDTGCGMDAETMSHIFEPFFTTKEPGKGTGLGLATAYGIVKQSGGNITAASAPGAGATFTIHMPFCAEPVEAPTAKPAPDRTLRGTETILLAEDENEVRGYIRKVLESSGYRVLEARHGAEALEIGLAKSSEIHLLLTDVIMPNMAGTELATKLTSALPGLPVLFMTGHTDETLDNYGALKPGMVFLEKPLRGEELTRKVRELLDQTKRSLAAGA